MIYRHFQDKKLSALGFGAMRLPTRNDVYADIDLEATEAMIDYAMKEGINYYDTAWGYHDGNSEIALARVLKKYPRESYFLADKFPGYDLANMDKVASIFEQQLQKCGVDYFDFYLFHNVCEMNIDAYLDPQYGIFDYLMAQKQKGRIKHLGFSCHGDLDVLNRFLEHYGHAMEFCQLQINYLDWTFQDAKLKVEILNKYGIPVWVMEPLRGGRLVKLEAEDEAKLLKLRPQESIPGWAFRFLQSIPSVTMILSGMSTLQQVKENVMTFANDQPLNSEEMSALLGIADKMIKKSALPCTGCRYCTSHCPMNLDIPTLIKLYNEHRFTGGGFIAPMVLESLDPSAWPTACIGCQSCEQVCPQQIAISKMMADFAKRLQ